MAKSKLVKANEKIAGAVVGGYKKVEETVVGGYKKMEDAVVGGYQKVENAFVDRYLTHEGETVEEAKERLALEQSAREESQPYKKQQGFASESMKKTEAATAAVRRKAGIEK